MCLAVPGEVIEIEGQEVKVDMLGNQLWARTDLVPDVELGDYVLIHAGVVINKIDEEAANETYALLEEIADAAADEQS
jgi:hydrogenase expression/formation protein HypC